MNRCLTSVNEKGQDVGRTEQICRPGGDLPKRKNNYYFVVRANTVTQRGGHKYENNRTENKERRQGTVL